MKQNSAPADLESISALADGQLRGDEFAKALSAVTGSEEAMATWHAYHVAGDVLRCGDLAECSGDMAFLARLRSRMPDPVRPGMPATHANVLVPEQAIPVDLGRAARNGANDPVTHWKWMTGVASLVAVAAVGWGALGSSGESGVARQLAGVTSRVPASASLTGAQATLSSTAEPAVMLRDPRLDELLAAHKQFGGTSALQMPAGFLRNATFASPGH